MFSALWFLLVFATGAVVGAKYPNVTLYVFNKAKPTLLKWKAALSDKAGKWFKKQ